MGTPHDSSPAGTQDRLPPAVRITVRTAERMRDLGLRLAALLEPGDLVLLNGELGAGKTTLTRGLGEGLGVRGAVTSPTFVIARVHPSLTGGPALVHVDASREFLGALAGVFLAGVFVAGVLGVVFLAVDARSRAAAFFCASTRATESARTLSARAAGERLDVGYNQIADMVRGKPPAEKTLIKFASAVGENPADWLRYGGKDAFAQTLEAQEGGKETQEQRMAQQIARELVRIPKERQGLLVRQIRALIRATQDDEK